jgi:hypothetical protein
MISEVLPFKFTSKKFQPTNNITLPEKAQSGTTYCHLLQTSSPPPADDFDKNNLISEV